MGVMRKNRPKESRRPGRPSHPVSKQEILQISRRQFAKSGFLATSLESVADAVGLRKASLLHHYSSKEALYLETLSSVVTELMEFVESARLNEGDFVSRLDRLGEKVVDYLARRPESARLLMMELTNQGPYLYGRGREQVRVAIQMVEHFLNAGMQAGVFRRQDPFQLSVSIVGLHLIYFAGGEIFSTVLERDIFSPDQIRRRRRAVVQQVRALCGIN